MRQNQLTVIEKTEDALREFTYWSVVRAWGLFSFASPFFCIGFIVGRIF